MTPGQGLLVVAAGFLGGASNAIAGGGTLVTFPALLAVGIPSVVANTSSSVGLLAGYAGGSLAYRRELVGQGARLRALLFPAVAGGLVGGLLLLLAPADSFKAVVPYLVLTACLLLAVRPRVAGFLSSRRPTTTDVPRVLQVLIGVGAVYGSYFGAGLGVVMLALLGLLLADDLQRLNALKGVLSLLINLVGVVVFLVGGRVDALAALLVAVGAALGATAGVALARRLPAAGVRGGVVVVGVTVAVVLIVRS